MEKDSVGSGVSEPAVPFILQEGWVLCSEVLCGEIEEGESSNISRGF